MSSDNEDFVRRREQFLAESAPWVEVKVRMFSLVIPKMIMHSDGRIERTWPSWTQEISDKCDAEIDAILKRIAANNHPYYPHSDVNQTALK